MVTRKDDLITIELPEKGYLVTSQDLFVTQWNKGQKLAILGVTDGTEVQFGNEIVDTTLNRPVTDGIVNIPDVMLTYAEPIIAYIQVITADSETTRYEILIRVEERTKPADYIYPEDEQSFREYMEQRLAEKQDKLTAGENIIIEEDLEGNLVISSSGSSGGNGIDENTIFAYTVNYEWEDGLINPNTGAEMDNADFQRTKMYVAPNKINIHNNSEENVGVIIVRYDTDGNFVSGESFGILAGGRVGLYEENTAYYRLSIEKKDAESFVFISEITLADIYEQINANSDAIGGLVPVTRKVANKELKEDITEYDIINGIKDTTDFWIAVYNAMSKETNITNYFNQSSVLQAINKMFYNKSETDTAIEIAKEDVEKELAELKKVMPTVLDTIEIEEECVGALTFANIQEYFNEYKQLKIFGIMPHTETNTSAGNITIAGHGNSDFNISACYIYFQKTGLQTSTRNKRLYFEINPLWTSEEDVVYYEASGIISESTAYSPYTNSYKSGAYPNNGMAISGAIVPTRQLTIYQAGAWAVGTKFYLLGVK